MTGSAIADPPAGTIREDDPEEGAGPDLNDTPTKTPPNGGTPEIEGELVVDGNGQLGFDIGGKPPTGSELRVVGGAIQVQGQFEKGALIEVRATLRVGEVAFSDKRDSQTGNVIDCVRRHKAKIVQLSVEG